MPDQPNIIDEARRRGVGKQITLPWSKAVEIAAKSMKIRFGRSVVTTASIILAIAFLMSILTSTTLIASLKTNAARRVVEFRDRAEKARRHENIGLELPEDLAAARENFHAIQTALADPRISTLDKRLRQAQLAAAQAQLNALTKTDPKDIEKAKALWPVLAAEVDFVRVSNEWQLLWRTLQSEGYTDLPLEITTAPSQLSFLGMLGTQMDPRDKWLALLAALVCFVGIWNAMLMSVHERFREIGTMKCLGALESFIVKLYFLESAFIGLVGTIAGIFIGFILAMTRAMYTYGITPVLQNFDFGGAVLCALGTLLVGALLSVGAAIFPARSAAKMDPIAAMRVDE